MKRQNTSDSCDIQPSAACVCAELTKGEEEQNQKLEATFSVVRLISTLQDDG